MRRRRKVKREAFKGRKIGRRKLSGRKEGRKRVKIEAMRGRNRESDDG